jgi:hypothetical protein
VVWRNSWPAARTLPNLEDLTGGASPEEGNRLRTGMRRKDAYLRQDERRALACAAVSCAGRPGSPQWAGSLGVDVGELSWRIRHSRPRVQSE